MKFSFILVALIGICFFSCTYPENPKTPRYNEAVEYKTKLLDSTRGYLNEMRTCYDVLFYHLDLAIFPNKKEISGSVEMTFRVMKDTKKDPIRIGRRIRNSFDKRSGRK